MAPIEFQQLEFSLGQCLLATGRGQLVGFPRGGALLMGLMGTAGTLSSRFVLPLMGSIYDTKKLEVAGGDAAFKALQPGPELDRVLGAAAQTSFRDVAILPAILLIVFGGIWMYDRSKGGFKATKIS